MASSWKGRCEDSMGYRGGWLRQPDGWWSKKDLGFKLKLTEGSDNKYCNCVLDLHHMVQYATHVKGLDKSGLASLASACDSGKLPNLTSLDISKNDIGMEGAKALALAIGSRQLKNLTELGLDWSNIGNKGMIALANSLQGSEASLLPNLRCLSLRKTDLSKVGMASLASALHSGKLPNLTSLHISSNYIGIEGAKALALAIGSRQLKNLTELHLDYNNIFDEGMIALANSLEGSGASLLPNLRCLNLQEISLTDVGMASLASALHSGKLPNLTSLNISMNEIGKEGAKALALAIGSRQLKNLTELRLDWSEIGDEGMIALANSLQESEASLLPNLRCLSLRRTSLTEVGMASLASALHSGKLPNLTSLDISVNSIGIKGAKALALAIGSRQLKNLTELHLDYNNIFDEGMTALANSFRKGMLLKLRFLKFGGRSENQNYFGKVGLVSLARALESGCLNSLEVLDLQEHGLLEEESARALVFALTTNKCLTVKVKFPMRMFPALESLNDNLIESNSGYRKRLVTAPKVQATFGKIYLCGNPEVGKTTLRRTLQRSFWQSVLTLDYWPRAEERTRGINVSQLSTNDKKRDEHPITLQVWDMAGQEDFHLVHNAFFPDLGFTEGNATTFVVVCSSEHSLHNSMEQLEYWLRYIASSCGKAIQNPRHVFVVMNNIGGGREIHKHAAQWKFVLECQREKFEQHLKVHTDLFLMDVRKFRQVVGLKNCVVEHSRNLLRNQEVPNICDAIQKNLSVLCREREQFPVLNWTEFVEQVLDLVHYPWPEKTIEAAAKYLNEAGVVIYINKEGVRLIVVDPNWFCRDVIGEVFLPWDMASCTKDLFRTRVDQTTGSISISNFKKFFTSSRGEWNDAQVDDLIAILLWLGLCYKGEDKNLFLPALIAEGGTPGEPWCLGTPVSHGADQWVMGFSVGHQKSDVTLAPISLWHRFQVDLAQNLEFNGHRKPDNDFVTDKYFVTFVVDYMNVLIEVDANLDKPTFEEINILVKPRFKGEQMDAAERKQCQVDLANDLVQRLLKLWLEVCRGVEYEEKVIWPWPASSPRPKDRPDRNVKVEQVKQSVQESGLGRKMHWVVGSGDPITEDQLLSTKDKRDLVNHQFAQTCRTSGIEGHARQVNDSLFELYSPDNTPKIQIVFFHGLQMEEYSDQHLAAWQSEDGSTIWPQTWLVEEIPEAHVLSVSYSGGLKHSLNGRVDMYIIGENLLSDLIQDGVGQVPHCPVVLVGHSIGGLVIKQLCRLAHNKFNSCQGHERAKLEMFLKNMGGIFYYATPHRGSEIAEILAKKLSSPLLTYFETLSNDPARLNYEFEAICKANYKDWLFAGLGEGLPTDLGQLQPRVEPIKYLVVPEASARGDDFNVLPGADHFSVCRPRSKTTTSFSKLQNFASRIARAASDAEKL